MLSYSLRTIRINQGTLKQIQKYVVRRNGLVGLDGLMPEPVRALALKFGQQYKIIYLIDY